MQKNESLLSKRRSNCPVSFSLDVFGDKWTLLILRDIMLYQRKRFSDFMPNEKIATNVLADRLAKLELADIISKQRDARLKNQYIYDVTPKGEQLLPIIVEMTLWGLEHDPQSLASTEFVERSRDEKPKVIREINRSIKRKKFATYRSEFMGINPLG
jgi:DNA-binding HxlR family transcriptional regulator